MVIVVDEYGNTAGLATMEDLLEVIIGEIRDEHEPDSDVAKDGLAGTSSPEASTSTAWAIFSPRSTARRTSNPTTVGGLVSEWLGRVPKAGEVGIGMASAWRCWPATICA